MIREHVDEDEDGPFAQMSFKLMFIGRNGRSIKMAERNKLDRASFRNLSTSSVDYETIEMEPSILVLQAARPRRSFDSQ